MTNVDPKALPIGAEELDAAGLGNWRAHMNIVNTIVREGISSALILEDDADWDIRIKTQMQDFARASRLLVQPLKGTENRYADPTFPKSKKSQSYTNLPVDANEEHTVSPTTSPYGDLDRWDLLWVGHCGTHFPEGRTGLSLGRAVIHNDETVPEPQHIEMQFGDSLLAEKYPAHTRIVHRAHMNLCTLGYALSLPGARRMLWEMGLRKLNKGTDVTLREMCDGEDGRPPRICLTVQPQLFQHHRPVGKLSTFSDISNHGDAVNEVAFSRNIRWSTRVNFECLVDSAPESEYIDHFADGEPRKDWGFGR